MAQDTFDHSTLEQRITAAIVKHLGQCGDDDVDCSPDISQKMVRNAQGSYLSLDAGESVIALYDGTRFRSGKTGFCLTTKKLAIKAHKRAEAATVPYSQLLEIQSAAYDADEVKVRLTCGGSVHTLELTEMSILAIPCLFDALQAVGLVLASEAGAAMSGDLARITDAVRRDLNEKYGETENDSDGAQTELDEKPLPLAEAIKKALREVKIVQVLFPPHIPEKKMANACAAYFVRQEGEEVLALCDATAFKSAKKGFVLTGSRLVWRGDSGSGEISYQQLTRLTGADYEKKLGAVELRFQFGSDTKTICLVWNKKDACRFLDALRGILASGEATESGSAQALFHLAELKKNLSGQSSERQAILPRHDDSAPLPEPITSALCDILPQILAEARSERFFVHPEVPAGQIARARESYAQVGGDETVLALCDTSTAFDGSKGFCMTDRRISYTSEQGNACAHYSQIVDAAYETGVLEMVLPNGGACLDTSEMAKWQGDMLFTAFLRLCHIVHQRTDPPPVRAASAVMVGVDGNTVERHGICILTEDAWCFVDHGGDPPVRVPWSKISGIEAVPGENTVVHREDNLFVECGLYEGAEPWANTMRALAQGHSPLQETAAGDKAATPSTTASGKPINISETIAAAFRPIAWKSIMVAPDLPDKKLRNAQKVYAKLREGEKVVVLVDDTLLGSGKRGFCLTNFRILSPHCGIPYLNLTDSAPINGEAVAIATVRGFVVLTSTALLSENWEMLAVLFRNLRDALPKDGNAQDAYHRIIRTEKVEMVGMDGGQIKEKGTLCLTTHLLAFCSHDELEKPFVTELSDINNVGKPMLGGQFIVELNARKGGLMGAIGLSGRRSVAFKSFQSADWQTAIVRASDECIKRAGKE